MCSVVIQSKSSRRHQRASVYPPASTNSRNCRVGHVMALDLKPLHVHAVRGLLVVPAKRHCLAVQPHGGAPGRHTHPFLRRRVPACDGLVARRPRFLGQRQPVPHVQQRLLVHRLVFEDGVGGFRAIEQRTARLVDRSVRQCIDHLTVGLGGKLPDHIAIGPAIARAHRRPTSLRLVRIDASRKELLEPRVDARTTQPSLHQCVEAERRQMAFIEHDRVSERDRPLRSTRRRRPCRTGPASARGCARTSRRASDGSAWTRRRA